MENIPTNFDHCGKQYICHVSKVSGAGDTSTFHLIDEKNFYLGRLRWSSFEKKLVFDAPHKTKELEQLADYFGDVVTAWYE